MKADEDDPDMEKQEKVVASDVELGRFDDQALSQELEEAASGDDIIELVEVIKEGSIPETVVSFPAEEKTEELESETLFRAEELRDKDRPGLEPETKLPSDLLMEEEKEREKEEEILISDERALVKEAYSFEKEDEPLAEFALEGEVEPAKQAEMLMEEEAGLPGEEVGLELAVEPEIKDIGEELNFVFAEMETEPVAPVGGAARDSGAEDFVIYDENSNVIGEVLADEEPDEFERELDSMLESLELPDEKESGLQFLDADLASLPDKEPFGEPEYGISRRGGGVPEAADFGRTGTLVSAGIAAAGAGYVGISDEPAEGEKEIIIGGTETSLGFSEEQLEALITRVAEKVAERISRQTMSEVAERVITEAIAALKQSLEV